MGLTRAYLRTVVDKVAFLTFFFGLFLNLAYECFIFWHYSHRLISISYSVAFICFISFCTVQVLWNLYYITTEDNRLKQETKDANGQDCGQTAVSQASSAALAQQSNHCSRCDARIIERDHHCWFVGNCIGAKNKSYFFVLCCYLWLMAYAENMYNLRFVCDVLGCSWMSIIAICMPHFPFLLRGLAPFIIAVNFATFLGILLFMVFTLQILKQFSLLFAGHGNQNKESTQPRHPLTPTAIYHNMKSVIGERWYLVFASPLFNKPTLKEHSE